MKLLTGLLGLVLISQTLSTGLEVFEATNGHEPQVAINCGRVPFHIDLETGAWVADSDGVAMCDHKKKKVLKYCQKKYPSLNISNIVESNKPVKFNNWCKPGQAQCDEANKVVPYRCLVKEYEADALVVPQGCKFDHIHNEDLCLSHDDWKKQARNACKKKYSMHLKDYGILLACGTDMFTGVEYVCCPKKHHKKKQHKENHAKTPKSFTKDQFSRAIKKFQKYLPLETKGCDRSAYLTKQSALEDHHRNQIAAVVEEWDDAEKHYNKLKASDPAAAEEKMKRTLEVFRETLATLEQESKAEKSRVRAEHAECINTQISKNKRDAMISYLAAIEEKPVNADKILKAVRKFIQVCEHDRVHSLRHFEHVRNRDAAKAESLKGELLQHLKDLNKVVNESMALLNYLPEIAKQFGISSNVGVVLKPRLEMPVDDHSAHDHERVKEILGSVKAKEEMSISTKETEAPTDAPPSTEEVPVVKTKEYDEDNEDYDFQDEDKDGDDDVENSIPLNKVDTTKDSDEAIQEKYEKKAAELMDRYEKALKNKEDTEKYEEEADKILAEKEARFLQKESKVLDKLAKKESHSPFAFNAVMGLSCGVLVIMLFLVVAMVVRRRRITRARVVLTENNDEREHLVEMQKNGFENPTYKFFYY